MCTFPSPPVVEMLGHLGFDWVLLDNEHGSITVDTAEACIAVAELSGIAPIVRPVGNKPEIIAPFLDRGAWGVQVPHVNTADEARAAVDAVKYAPEGHRGIFSGSRPAGYGFKGSTGDYAKDANRQTLVCLMLEEVKAMVDEAHRLGRKVAAHAHGTESIRDAIRAGVDSIEHAS